MRPGRTNATAADRFRAPPTATAGGRVLLVDDEPDLLALLAEAIRMSLTGVDVVTASGADEAREAIDAGGISVVVVDYKLDFENGLDLLAHARARLGPIPLFVLTGQAPGSVERRASAFGARVLWKPIPLQSWIREIRSAIGTAPTPEPEVGATP